MNSIVAWDALEQAVDRLAEILVTQIEQTEDVVCCLPFDEAEALAEVLEAGSHAAAAAHLMHRWALTDPDWENEHGEVVRRWLAMDQGAGLADSG